MNQVVETAPDLGQIGAWGTESPAKGWDGQDEAQASQDGHQGSSVQPFVIDSEDKAAWVVDKMVEADQRIERLQAQFQARLSELRAERQRLDDRFGAELENWARGEAERRKRRSVTLSTGTLAFRKVPGRLTIANAEDAQCGARQAGVDAFETREVFLPAVYREAAQAHLEETGELLPGVELVPERDSFSVGVAKPKAAKAAPAQEGGEG